MTIHHDSAATELPIISLYENGCVGWNDTTQRALGNPKFVDLLIDQEAERLGLRPAEEREDNFPVRKSPTQSLWIILSQGSLNVMNLPISGVYRRHAEIVNEILSIDISSLIYRGA